MCVPGWNAHWYEYHKQVLVQCRNNSCRLCHHHFAYILLWWHPHLSRQHITRACYQSGTCILTGVDSPAQIGGVSLGLTPCIEPVFCGHPSLASIPSSSVLPDLTVGSSIPAIDRVDA